MSSRIISGLGIAISVIFAGCHHPQKSAPLAPAWSEATVLPQAPPQQEPVITPVKHVTVELLPPPTIDAPFTLEEALATAFRNSEIVRTVDSDDSIPSTTTYDQMIADEQKNAALAAFDTSLATIFNWSRFEGPPSAFIGPGIERAERLDQATFSTGLTKRWALGTETRLSYAPSPGYLYFPSGTSGFNPSHVSATELAVRQPLLKGAGTAVNTAPITIAQLKTDQSTWKLKMALLELARSVEESYWNLQAALAARQALADQIPLIDEIVRLEDANVGAQRSVPSNAAKARAGQHALRRDLVEVQRIAWEAEQQLRNVIGLDPQDARRIIPVSPPIRARVVIDRELAIASAMDHQPVLKHQRLLLEVRQVELAVAQNRFHPQLDLQALYRMNGLEDDLDDSLSMMFRQDYADWEFGAVFSIPLGRNAERANIRAAELQLARERALLREGVRSTIYQVNTTVERIRAIHEQYLEADLEVREANKWLDGARIRFRNPPLARMDTNWMLLALDDYLEAMDAAAEAATEASKSLALYNTELAKLEEVKGTLLFARGVNLLGDPCTADLARKLPRMTFEEASLMADSEAMTPASFNATPVSTSIIPLPSSRAAETVRLPPIDHVRRSTPLR